MKRRAFIAGLGSAATWPIGAGAQQPERIRKLGVLSGAAENDPINRTWFSAFDSELHSHGWNEGQNIGIERRYAPGDVGRTRTYAKELVALHPDLIFVTNTPSALALLQETRTIPILFTNVSDPVGSGLVSSLANPGGNITGFTNFEFTIGGKWLQLLKEVAPDVKRAAIIYNPTVATYWNGYFRSIQAAASSLAVESIPAPIHDFNQLDRVLVEQARVPGGSVIVIPDIFTVPNRERIIASSARYRLPAIYPYRVFAQDGGLMAYGPDITDLYRQAASYVNRILRGVKPGDLAVQQPTRFELVLNLKTAKTLGLIIPNALVILADEVIQ